MPICIEEFVCEVIPVLPFDALHALRDDRVCPEITSPGIDQLFRECNRSIDAIDDTGAFG